LGLQHHIKQQQQQHCMQAVAAYSTSTNCKYMAEISTVQLSQQCCQACIKLRSSSACS